MSDRWGMIHLSEQQEKGSTMTPTEIRHEIFNAIAAGFRTISDISHYALIRRSALAPVLMQMMTDGEIERRVSALEVKFFLSED